MSEAPDDGRSRRTPIRQDGENRDGGNRDSDGRAPDIEEWYRDYADDIYTFLAYFLGSKDVEDLVSDTFMRALRGLDGYKGMAAPKTWLMRIARNVAISQSRKTHFPQIEVFADAIAHNHVDPADVVVSRDEASRMLTYLASVRSAYRQVVLLRTVLDFSVRETAEVLGWSENKVNVTYHRALKALSAYVQREEGGLRDER